MGDCPCRCHDAKYTVCFRSHGARVIEQEQRDGKMSVSRDPKHGTLHFVSLSLIMLSFVVLGRICFVLFRMVFDAIYVVKLNSDSLHYTSICRGLCSTACRAACCTTDPQQVQADGVWSLIAIISTVRPYREC